jgi:hypothetical protein
MVITKERLQGDLTNLRNQLTEKEAHVNQLLGAIQVLEQLIQLSDEAEPEKAE